MKYGEILFAEATHIGLVQPENQDRSGTFTTPIGQAYAVADGMGGHLAGAFAAELAMQLLQGSLAQVDSDAPPRAALKSAMQTVNQQIHRQSRFGNPDTEGMGSTLVCALLQDGVATIAHVGDSRAYHWSGGALRHLTRDHTLVEQLVENGVLTEAQASRHYQAGVLTRALGPESSVEPEVRDQPVVLSSGDMLLLCTDGLCGYVTDEAIASTLDRHPEPDAAAHSLVTLALEAGGKDNVTVQVIAPRWKGPEPNPKRRRWGLLGIATLVAETLAGSQPGSKPSSDGLSRIQYRCPVGGK